jgi:hypothetical protein
MDYGSSLMVLWIASNTKLLLDGLDGHACLCILNEKNETPVLDIVEKEVSG